MYETARKLSSEIGQVTFAFSTNSLDLMLQNRPLRSWLHRWLGDDKADWLKDKILKIDHYPEELIEVSHSGQRSLGLTMTINSDSWCLSFHLEGSPWRDKLIDATRVDLIEDKLVESDCKVRNLSQPDHVRLWNAELADWEINVSRNNVIYDFGEHRIEMYPHDHGYPHVHLVKNHKTAAKFRVDEFQRLEGKPTWDADISRWISENRAQLLSSWERCQQGKRPISLMDD